MFEQIQKNKNKYFQDSVGNYVLAGDLVRMLHFSTSKKKYYMYKRVLGYLEKDGFTTFIELEHLDTSGKFRAKPSELVESYVIVQRAKFHNDYRIDDLKRNKKLRD